MSRGAGGDERSARPASTRRARQRVESIVEVCDVRLGRRGHAPALEVRVADAAGEIRLVFLGRRALPGMEVGAWLWVAGTLLQESALRESAPGPRGAAEEEVLSMWNPAYRFVVPPG
jgi:hypothetical protein